MGSTFSRIKLRLFGHKEMYVAMIGLDNAGKTTILYKLRLKLGEVATTIPAIGFYIEKVTYRNFAIAEWDIGGAENRFRLPWLQLYENSQGIIFVVDSNDRERIEEARDLLHQVLAIDQVREVPLIVFANKQDLPDAMSTSEVSDALGLHTIRGRKWFIQGTCAFTCDGVDEGLDWISPTPRNN